MNHALLRILCARGRACAFDMRHARLGPLPGPAVLLVGALFLAIALGEQLRWGRQHVAPWVALHPVALLSLVLVGAIVVLIALRCGLTLSGSLQLIKRAQAAHADAETATAALHTSEERYRRIVETAQEGIWQVDADGRTTFMVDTPQAMDVLNVVAHPAQGARRAV